MSKSNVENPHQKTKLFCCHQRTPHRHIRKKRESRNCNAGKERPKKNQSLVKKKEDKIQKREGILKKKVWAKEKKREQQKNAKTANMSAQNMQAVRTPMPQRRMMPTQPASGRWEANRGNNAQRTYQAPAQQQQQMQRPKYQPGQAASGPGPVMQSINPQQLASMVGETEAACMMQAQTQYITQTEVVLIEQNVKFITQETRTKLVPVVTIPQASVLVQPSAMVQLTSCAQPQSAPANKCSSEPSRGCADGGCNYSAYNAGPYRGM
jgi:hypothetical protein